MRSNTHSGDHADPATPKIFRRSIDTKYRCIVRLPSGKACQRGTDCRNADSALQYAHLLQRDINRRAENGNLLPPPRASERES